MKNLTKQQFEILRNYEKDLSSAYYSHTVIGMNSKDLNILLDIYVALGYTKQNINCGVCVISFLSTLARFYYDMKEKIEAKTKEQKNIHIEAEHKQDTDTIPDASGEDITPLPIDINSEEEKVPENASNDEEPAKKDEKKETKKPKK